MKIIFFGTPEFAVKSLDAIVSAGYEVCCVVTTPDRIGGRGNKLIESDVKKYAVSNNIPILQPEKLRDPNFVAQLKEYNADLFIVIAFRMLPEVVWEIPKMGTFNLHASLLPEFRGAAPINHAIIEGKDKTGVTTFLINNEIDKGSILLKKEVEIKPEDNAGSLHDKLMEVGAKLVIDTIKGLLNDSITPSPQPVTDILSPAPKIFKSNSKINFKQSAKQVNCFIRGLSPYPGAWSIIKLYDGRELEVKIFKTQESDEYKVIKPCSVYTEKKHMYVGTSNGVLEILEIQPAGKRRMLAKEFLAGYEPCCFI